MLQFEQFLGNGAFGLVFKASEPKNDQDLLSAVKFLTPNCGHEDKHNFRREFTILGGKTHPNVVRNYKLVEKRLMSRQIRNLFRRQSDESPRYSENVRKLINNLCSRADAERGVEGLIIQMELCGETLRIWVRDGYKGQEWERGWLEWKRVQVGQGLISGMKFLHENDIIHGDFKPENAYFAKGGYQLPIKIGDFGLTRIISGNAPETAISADMTRRMYQPPENDPNSESSAEYNHNSQKQGDLFSLGLVLLEVFQGDQFQQNKAEVFQKLVYDNLHNQIKEHPTILNLKDLIIKLTYRDLSLRMNPEEYNSSLILCLKYDFLKTMGGLDHSQELGREFFTFVHNNCFDSSIYDKVWRVMDRICGQFKDMELNMVLVMVAVIVLACSWHKEFLESHFKSMLFDSKADAIFNALVQFNVVIKKKGYLVETHDSFHYYYYCSRETLEELNDSFLNNKEFLTFFGKIFAFDSNNNDKMSKWMLDKLVKGKSNNPLAHGCFETVCCRA